MSRERFGVFVGSDTWKETVMLKKNYTQFKSIRDVVMELI